MMEYNFDQVYKIPIDQIHIDESKNCRGKIAISTLTQLAQDIDINGLHQPIIVRLATEEDQVKEPLILVAGFRRTFAHKLLKRTEVEGIVRKIDAIEAMVINFSENIQREDLNLLQEAQGLAKMMRIGLTIPDIANRIQKPHSWVRTRSMLLRLEPELQELAAAGILSPQNIMDLWALKSKDDRMLAARAIREKRERGFSGPIKVKIKRPEEEAIKKKLPPRKMRPQAEIFNLLDYLAHCKIPMGFHSRCLAWAAGEISDNELIENLTTHCEELGIEYTAPEEDGIPKMKGAFIA